MDEPTLDELLAAPVELSLGAQHLLLQSNLLLLRTVDGFFGGVRVLEKEQQDLPPRLDVRRIWVILGEEVWFDDSLVVVESEANFELILLVSSDRAWGNVTVQVVVELSVGEELHLLRAEDQRIEEVM